MANIIFHEDTKTFHLYNQKVSYIIQVLENGHLGQLYYGKKIHDKSDFSYLVEKYPRPMTSYIYEDDRTFSLEHIRQEYPVYGTTDYRHPAVEVLQENGSRISDFRYQSHEISEGKPKLAGLPATYTEDDEEAKTLCVTILDPVTQVKAELLYTIFDGEAAIARSVKFCNEGTEPVHLLSAMSLSIDLPDKDYVWMQLSGAWSRERHVKNRILEQGIVAIDSMRGNSSHEHNPFMVLKRPNTTEREGEVIGFSLIYSGNFRIQAEVDTHDVTRITAGINPSGFDWKLDAKENFQTPEAVMVYSDSGLNDMSQTFHRLYGRRLARGYWRDRPRPILNNNWEATYFDFTEERLVEIAAKAKECGVELFVLDDGWFGERNSDHAGLGDWAPNKERLPKGIRGLSEKIEALGMKFGLWFEPEMTNKDSDLYREHPDWLLADTRRQYCHSRNQYVLDFSKKEVVDHIHAQMRAILKDAPVSYVKWDMNRAFSEVFSNGNGRSWQGKVRHKYILGVYDLYERLTGEFTEILFESCASGGARFDPGMLYYAPQAWTSDNTDAIDRIKIQYGTSYVYPISSIGSHVSAAPNHQVFRDTPLETRANVAFFGTFGYELDITKLPEDEIEKMQEQISFMKEHRKLIQQGVFTRLESPFEGNNSAWQVASEKKDEVLMAYFRLLEPAQGKFERIYLKGLEETAKYSVRECFGAHMDCGEHYGDELMYAGLSVSDCSAGIPMLAREQQGDYFSRLFYLKKVEE